MHGSIAVQDGRALLLLLRRPFFFHLKEPSLRPPAAAAPPTAGCCEIIYTSTHKYLCGMARMHCRSRGYIVASLKETLLDPENLNYEHEVL